MRHLTLKNTENKNSTIGILGGCESCLFLNNRIHDMHDSFNSAPFGTGVHWGYGTYQCIRDSIMDGNEVYHTKNQGIMTYTTSTGPGDTVNGDTCGGANGRNIYRNNYIHDSTGDAFNLYYNDNALIYNNLIANMVDSDNNVGNFALQWQGNLNFLNNTIAGGSYGIATNASVSGVVQNNIFSVTNSPVCPGFPPCSASLTLTCSNNLGTTAGGCTGNTGTDPLFVHVNDPRDFHLTSGSAAINAGMNLTPIFTMDKDGVSRPSSAAWDAGAFQLKSSVISLLPPQNLRVVP